MVLALPEGVSEVILTFGGVSQPRGAVCTFAVANENATPPAEIAALLAPLLEDVMTATAVTSCSINRIGVKNGPRDTGPFAELAVELAGDQGSDASATQVSMAVRKRTDLGGVSNRGRMYWPGISDGTINVDGTITGGALADYQEAWNTFFDALTDLTLPAILLHTEPRNPTLITSFEVASRTITQRRRNR